jgi:diadenylate cyclase
VTERLLRIVADLTARDVIIGVVDILIVYYAIYRVLLLIKGTRAAQMVIGLVLIGASYFAAKTLEITTVSWLLDNFINYFIIIIIVVFQHDIRRGLVRIGQNLFAFGRTYEETHVFEEVVHASEILSKRRIGAIFVFEREADLSDLVKTGAVLDSRVDGKLLAALCIPSRDNVLHDGAILIKNLRIQQAGAVLPLSNNPRLDPELGTRHQAAIGITEETDAVAVVVSEERGEISLCLSGNIARDLDASQLRKALLGIFSRKNRQKAIEEEATAAAAVVEALGALAQQGEGDGEPAPAPAPAKPERGRTSGPQEPVSGIIPGPRAGTAPPEAG